jgi:hypothetical protein
MRTTQVSKNYINELKDKTTFVKELSTVVKNYKNLKLNSIDFQVYKTKSNDLYEFIVVNGGQAVKNCTYAPLKAILEIVYDISNGGHRDELLLWDMIRHDGVRITNFEEINI